MGTGGNEICPFVRNITPLQIINYDVLHKKRQRLFLLKGFQGLIAGDKPGDEHACDADGNQ